MSVSVSVPTCLVYPGLERLTLAGKSHMVSSSSLSLVDMQSVPLTLPNCRQSIHSLIINMFLASVNECPYLHNCANTHTRARARMHTQHGCLRAHSSIACTDSPSWKNRIALICHEAENNTSICWYAYVYTIHIWCAGSRAQLGLGIYQVCLKFYTSGKMSVFIPDYKLLM